MSLNNDRDQRAKFQKDYNQDQPDEGQEEEEVVDDLDEIDKELPLVLQTSEEARNKIIERNKTLF